MDYEMMKRYSQQTVGLLFYQNRPYSPYSFVECFYKTSSIKTIYLVIEFSNVEQFFIRY
jgi:hypothetical protein